MGDPEFIGKTKYEIRNDSLYIDNYVERLMSPEDFKEPVISYLCAGFDEKGILRGEYFYLSINFRIQALGNIIMAEVKE